MKNNPLAGMLSRRVATQVGILVLVLGLLSGAGLSPARTGDDLQARENARAVDPVDQNGQICGRCGYRNDSNWSFCVSCGKKLEAKEEEASPDEVAALLRKASRAVFRVRSAVRVPGRRGQDDGVRMSLGSAVLIDDEGTVVTSTRSLMPESSKAELFSSDGESQVALIVARDPATELAVLRIQTGDLQPLQPCEDEVSLQVGDQAWYIGYPIATNPDDGTTSILPQSIKRTMISGLRVGGLERLQIEDLIIFDAELNTATGGGALLSSRGCLLGIGVEPRRTTVSIATAWDDTGRATVEALKNGSAPVRYYLGLGLAPVADFERHKYGIARPEGVLVDFVIPGSPAAEADIQKGDLVVEIAQQPVDDPATLQRDIPPAKDSSVTLVLNRDGKVRKLALVPALRPEHLELDILDEVEQWFGLGFEAVMYGGVSKTGLHVTAIRPGGQGEKYLEIGDVLQKVNQVWVNDEKSFRQVAGDNPNAIWMRIRRPSKGLFSLVYRRGYQTFRQPMVY